MKVADFSHEDTNVHNCTSTDPNNATLLSSLYGPVSHYWTVLLALCIWWVITHT